MVFGDLKAYLKAKTEVDMSYLTPQEEKVYDLTEFYPGVTGEIALNMPTPKEKEYS